MAGSRSRLCLAQEDLTIVDQISDGGFARALDGLDDLLGVSHEAESVRAFAGFVQSFSAANERLDEWLDEVGCIGEELPSADCYLFLEPRKLALFDYEDQLVADDVVQYVVPFVDEEQRLDERWLRGLGGRSLPHRSFRRFCSRRSSSACRAARSAGDFSCRPQGCLCLK